MSTTFGALGVPDDLTARLAAAGITEPFAIQAAVIPDALAGRDVTGRAPTGSGKTLAFGIPLVANLQPAQRRRPTALVLAPTRELAEQIAAELRPLARARRHDVVSVYGGVGYGPQRKALDNGAELVVACPGRLEDLLTMRALSLEDVDAGRHRRGRPHVRHGLPARRAPHPRADRRRAPGAAVLGDARRRRRQARRRGAAPARSATRSAPAGPDMTLTRHAFWSVDRLDRPDLTADVVRALGSTMVFCRTRHGADRLARQLEKLGVSAAPIHGGRSQPQRDRALKAFQTGAVAALVATDVAARGVHVDDVAGGRPLRSAGGRLDVRAPLGSHGPRRRVRRRRVVRRARRREGRQEAAARDPRQRRDRPPRRPRPAATVGRRRERHARPTRRAEPVTR